MKENPFLDSYVIEFLDLPQNFKGADLRKGLIQNMKEFILEVGKDFTFIDDEVVEYAMSRSMSPIMVAEYKLQLPNKAVLQRKLQELINIPAVIAGMLHDIYSYANMDSNDHAHKGAEMARNILNSLNIFNEVEKNLICTAIYNHSDKSIMHDSLDELLKDADVMHIVTHFVKTVFL